MTPLIVSSSRADYGLLVPVAEALGSKIYQCWNYGFAQAFTDVGLRIDANKPDVLVVLGDRYEILAATTAAHLKRTPIAHIGGGDVTLGSYDDAMRDCISRMATWHFVTSPQAQDRLAALGYNNVRIVGSPGIDVILRGEWRKERPIAEPYVVVSYQAETIDGTVDLDAVREAIGNRHAVWITPNPDRGSERIPEGVSYSHHEFLNLLHHCEEFIGNSSAIFYEAPFFSPPVKCRIIGKRQQGRVIPFGDGRASERIAAILREAIP